MDKKLQTISEFCGLPAGSFGEFMLDQKEKWKEYNKRQSDKNSDFSFIFLLVS